MENMVPELRDVPDLEDDTTKGYPVQIDALSEEKVNPALD
jgi:hypothetical protein